MLKSITLNSLKQKGKLNGIYRAKTLGSQKDIIVKISCRLLYNYNQEPIELLGTLQDVTKEKTAKDKLEQSRQDYIDLANSLPVMVWKTDPKGTQLYRSDNWDDWMGKGSGLQQFVEKMHPDDVDKVLEAWLQSLKQGIEFREECRLESKTGGYEWFISEGRPIRNENGEITSWVGSLTNINDQKSVKDKLSEALTRVELKEKRFQKLAQLMPEKLSIANATGEPYYFNDKWSEHLNITSEQLSISEWSEMMYPDNPEYLIKTWKKGISAGSSFEIEHKLTQNGNDNSWYLTRTKPVKDNNGNISDWIIVTTKRD